jgi:diphthine synthase
MAELIFVGLGLGAGGVSMGALEALKGCDRVFAEIYTAPVHDHALADISEAIGKKVVVLGRKEVEDGRVILDAAKRGRVAIIVPGDPMVATTHVDLRMRAAKDGIKTRVFHAGSVATAAAGLLGLQSYKFGRTTTLPFTKPGYAPTSPYDAIEANVRQGLHTLVLLDIDSENDRAMTGTQGLQLLMELESKVKRGVLTDVTIVCVVARAGHDDALVRAGELAQLAKEDFGAPPHCLVVPGKLHFMEAEALVGLAGAPKSIL